MRCDSTVSANGDSSAWYPLSRELEGRVLRRGTALAKHATPPAAVKPGESECELPQEQKSVRFAVIGDSGTGGTEQYQVAEQMENMQAKTRF